MFMKPKRNVQYIRLYYLARVRSYHNLQSWSLIPPKFHHFCHILEACLCICPILAQV